jgi:hypothetical protein
LVMEKQTSIWLPRPFPPLIIEDPPEGSLHSNFVFLPAEISKRFADHKRRPRIFYYDEGGGYSLLQRRNPSCRASRRSLTMINKLRLTFFLIFLSPDFLTTSKNWQKV